MGCCSTWCLDIGPVAIAFSSLMDTTGWCDQLCTCTSSVADEPVSLRSLQHLPEDRSCGRKSSQGIQPYDSRRKRGMKWSNFDLVCTGHAASFRIERLLHDVSTQVGIEVNVVRFTWELVYF